MILVWATSILHKLLVSTISMSTLGVSGVLLNRNNGQMLSSLLSSKDTGDNFAIVQGNFGDLTVKPGSNKGIKMRSLPTRILNSSLSSTSTLGQGNQSSAVSEVYSSRISTSTSDSSSIIISIAYDRFSSNKTQFVLRMSFIFLNILDVGLKDVLVPARQITSESLVPLRVETLCPSPVGSSFDIIVHVCKNSILNLLRFRNSFS